MKKIERFVGTLIAGGMGTCLTISMERSYNPHNSIVLWITTFPVWFTIFSLIVALPISILGSAIETARVARMSPRQWNRYMRERGF